MIAIANGESLLPDVEDWMDRDTDDDGENDGNFVAFPQQAFRIMVSAPLLTRPHVPCDPASHLSTSPIFDFK